MLVDYCSNCRRHKVIVDSIQGLCADCAGRQTGPVVPPRRPPFKPELNPNPVDITTLKPRTNICKNCRTPVRYGQIYCIDCFKKMPKGLKNSRKIGKHPTEKPDDPIDDLGQHVFAPETEEPAEKKGRDVFSIETPYLEVPMPDYTVDEFVINERLTSIKKDLPFESFLLEISLTAALCYLDRNDNWINLPSADPGMEKARLDTAKRVEQCKKFLRDHCQEVPGEDDDKTVDQMESFLASDQTAENWENPDASDSL